MYKKSLVLKLVLVLGVLGLFGQSFFCNSKAVNAATVQAASGLTSSTATYSLDPNSPIPKPNYVDANNGATDIPLLAFDLKNKGNAVLDQVTVAVGDTTAHISGFTIWSGNVEIGYQTYNGGQGSVKFDNLSLGVVGTSSVYTIKANLAYDTVNASYTKLSVTDVEVLNSYGKEIPAKGNAAIDYTYFYHAIPQLNFVSASANSTGNSSATAMFNLSATPYPGQAYAYALNGSDFTVLAINSAGLSTVVSNKSLVYNNIAPINGFLAAGQQYLITLNANATGLVPDVYTFQISKASSTVQDAQGHYVHIDQTYGLNNFVTPKVRIGGAVSTR